MAVAGSRVRYRSMRRRSVWWLWPAAPLLLLVGSTLLIANAVPATVYERAWLSPKQLDAETTLLLMGGLFAMVAGALLAGLAERDPGARPQGAWPALSDEAMGVLRRVYPYLILLTLFGYAVWILNGLAKGLTMEDVQAVLTTPDNSKLPVKRKLETLPGITTLTQVAIVAAVVGVVIDLDRPSAPVRWAYRGVILLAAIRAMMLAERLAIAELLIPVMVLRAAALARRADRRTQIALRLAPVFGVFLLLIGFAASEYTRSWNWYSFHRDQSFVEFSSERLLGYYSTSHNNGAAMLKYGEEFADVPYYTTSFFWEIPPGSQIGGELPDDAADDRRELRQEFGNPEFNSPGGLAAVFADYGTIGGLVFWLALGILVGGLHLSFLHGRILGILLYPAFFVGFLELPRYLYWFQGRIVPAVVVSLAIAGHLAAKARRRLRWQALAGRRRPSPRLAR